MFPRNIRRIEPWKLVCIGRLIEACSENIVKQDIQDQLYEQLAILGVKTDANEYGIRNPGGLRTYLAQLACLGLFWQDDKTQQYATTFAGEELLAGREPVKVLRCQLMRMQYPSAYGDGNNVRVDAKLQVKPFAFLIKLLKDERLEGKLSCEEIAVPVVYGHKNTDYEKCVFKILSLRNDEKKLADVIDSVDDLRTPRRFNALRPQEDFNKGIKDAINIANTAKNYLQAALLVAALPKEGAKEYYELTDDAQVLAEIEPYLNEKIEPFDPDFKVAFQQRYGRYTKTKAVRSLKKRSSASRGFESLVQTAFIREVTENPFAVNINDFAQRLSASYGWQIHDVTRALNPVISRQKNIERDAVIRASLSGGKDAIVLEKAVTQIFQKLGFDESEHIGQRKVSKGKGGFPDIRIKCSVIDSCGFGDSKATSKYGFDINDQMKLQTYYNDREKEFTPPVPSTFFVYIAGGFKGSVQTITNKLNECCDYYRRPVSAITVQSLLDLAESEKIPSPQSLVKVFEKGKLVTTSDFV